MGRIRITLVAAVLGGAGWISGVGSAANATPPPCAQVSDVNSDIQGAHKAGSGLRKLLNREDLPSDLNRIGGVLSGALDGTVHPLVNAVCNPNPDPSNPRPSNPRP